MKTLRFNRQSIRLAMAALVMVCLFCGGRNARADSQDGVYEHLSEAMTHAAGRIKSVVSTKVTQKSENSAAVVLGQFTFEPASKDGQNAASSGPGVALALAKALGDTGVSVHIGAQLTVEGSYSPSTVPLPGGVPKTALNIKVAVKKKNSSQVFAMNVKITDIEEIGQIIGVTLNMDIKRPAQEQLVAAIKEPQTCLKSTEIYAGENSAYGIEILVRDSTTGRLTPRVPREEAGTARVSMSHGEIYAVRVINKSDYAAAVKVGIDGLSTFAFSDNNYQHFIIEAGKSATIPGWHINNTESQEFLVGSLGKAPAFGLLHSKDAIGMINVSFTRAWKPNKTAPPGVSRSREAEPAGTHLGKRIKMKYEEVKMKTDDKPIAFVTVRYANSPTSK